MIQYPRVENSPQRSPGSCLSCGSGSQSDRKWFLDTDMDESDSPGVAIILCDICFDILAGICGYEPTGKMARSTKLRIEELERQVDEFSELGATLRFFGLDLAHLADLRSKCEMVDGGILPPAREASTSLSGGDSKDRSGSKGFTESSDDETVGKLRSGKSSSTSELSL